MVLDISARNREWYGVLEDNSARNWEWCRMPEMKPGVVLGAWNATGRGAR